MIDVYLSIGSNFDRSKNIAAALQLIGEQFGPLTLSPIYESSATDGVGENYHNLCVSLVSELSLGELHQQIKMIENTIGRNRDIKAVVAIDIDILIFGDQIIGENESEQLTLPHPDLLRCAHVLTPLTDIAPDLVHPQNQKTIAQLRQEIGAGESLTKIL